MDFIIAGLSTLFAGSHNFQWSEPAREIGEGCVFQPDVVLLENPLSAFDSHIGTLIVENCSM